MQLCSEGQRARWPGCYHYTSDLWPLRRVEFDGLQLWAPCRPEPYLDRLYPEWQTKVVDYGFHSQAVQHARQQEAQHVDAHGVPDLLPHLSV